MTVKETGLVMDILEAAYPQFYRNQDNDERTKATKLWAIMFADDDVELVLAAVRIFIASDTKGFPPVIGIIKSKIAQITSLDTMTEYEAWNLIREAIDNSGGGKLSKGYYSGGTWSETYQEDASVTIIDGKPLYRTGGEYVVISEHDSCIEAFNNLPPILQRLVGSPNQLLEWGRMGNEALNTVIASNFMRSYRVRAEHEREYLLMPGDVKSYLSTIGEKFKLPELPAPLTEYEINERRNEIYNQLEI